MSEARYDNGQAKAGSVVATAPIREKTPADVLRHQLGNMGSELKNALPSHIKPEKFQRVVLTVVQQNQDLLGADRRSLLGACMKCAADGLIPDGREAALVMFGKAVTYMPMMAGIQKRVRNSGAVSGMEAHVIYEHDAFVWRQGLQGTIEHTPKFPGDRGKPIGAYAVARFKDGSDPQFEVMDINAIERVRSVSRSKGNGPWVQWWDEMARKTVFRRLAKWLPMDADAEDLFRRDDENERTPGATIDATPESSPAKPSKLDALEAPTDNFPGDTYDADTGEVVDEIGDDLTWLIAQVEEAKDEATLTQIERTDAVRAKVKGLSAEEGKRFVVAVSAARRGFAGGGGR